MFLPETWGFGVALHSREDRDHVTVGDWIAFKMVNPPFVKGLVWSDKEWLFRWWGFRERIGDVGTKKRVGFLRQQRHRTNES